MFMSKEESNIIDYGFIEIFKGGIKYFTIDNSIFRLFNKREQIKN